MELTISMKGGKYMVQDKKMSRQIYTIKKKGFGSGKYVLLDASNYQLYSLVQESDSRKPAFIIMHNDNSIIRLECRSLFLDPTIKVEGNDIQGTKIEYEIASKDHRDFQIMKADVAVGSITTKLTMNNELQYDMVIENKMFDDYIPFFVLAVDLAYGEMNRNI